MRTHRGGQIGERIELLHLAGARHCQQTGDGELAGVAPVPEHEFASVDRGPERAFGPVIRRLDAVMMHDRRRDTLRHVRSSLRRALGPSPAHSLYGTLVTSGCTA